MITSGHGAAVYFPLTTMRRVLEVAPKHLYGFEFSEMVVNEEMQQVVEKIVARRNRIEHSGDAIGGLVRRCRHSSKVQRYGCREEVDDPDIPVEVERLLHL